MDTDRPTLRAFPWHPATALQCLNKGTTIACALRLVAEHHGNAEPYFIALTKY